MNPNLTEIVFILDRSGSMAGLEADTIGGYINFKARKGRRASCNCRSFDHKYECLYRASALKMLYSTDQQYFVRGCTALYDAVGRAVTDTGLRLAKTPESDRPTKVISSLPPTATKTPVKYTHQQVQDMIRHQQGKYSWEFYSSARTLM